MPTGRRPVKPAHGSSFAAALSVILPPGQGEEQVRLTELMTTREVADYLRIKERKIYELVRTRQIPCTRLTGKWLFPKALIDAWVAENSDVPGESPAKAPPVIAGSRDPLLDWAARESGCGLALIAGGSLDGLTRFIAGDALVAGLHVYDPESGDFNLPAVRNGVPDRGIVLIEWARRDQGLILAAGNPHGVRGVEDLAKQRLPVIRRQPTAGAQLLLDHFIAEAGLGPDDLAFIDEIAHTGNELGLAILEGRAAAGLGLRAVARQLKLDFLPLITERFDLLLHRRDFFEPPFQTLLAFCRGAAFEARAAAMGGYDVSGLGRVRLNGP
jgi:putative molybdopterin biosynthesis protein